MGISQLLWGSCPGFYTYDCANPLYMICTESYVCRRSGLMYAGKPSVNPLNFLYKPLYSVKMGFMPKANPTEHF